MYIIILLEELASTVLKKTSILYYTSTDGLFFSV